MGGMVVGDEEGIARRFWIKFSEESIFAMYTPFVVCLASGVLDSQSFIRCVSQDLYFLQAFAQAYELAEECADDDEDKAAILHLRKRVLKKLKMHDILVQEWGFELPEEPVCDSATVKYTDFLLATASGKVEGEKFPGKIATPFEKTKIAAYILGAMAPYMRLYVFISKQIQALIDPEGNHIYRKWIDSFSSQKFEESAMQIEDLLDKLSISLTGEELEVLEKIYHQAMKLGVAFFSAQPVVQQTIVPFSQFHHHAEYSLNIFCNFDMTCTSVDSSALLAEIAIRTARKADVSGFETQLNQMSSADLQSTWAVLSSQYTEEYEECMENIIVSESAGEFDYGGLCRALEQISSFEKRANSRVIQSGVLKGLNVEDIKWAGEHLILQDGCREFFQKGVRNDNTKTDVHVLSYCWCGDIIRSAFSSGGLNALTVHSNELAYEECITTGGIITTMESPLQKLQAFNDVLKGCSEDGENLTIYIGGMVGDLLCLLEADVGIVIGPSSSSLRRLGNQFGISFVPLFSGLVKKQRNLSDGSTSNWKGLSGILYTVSSWEEIHAFVFGL